MKVVKNTTAFDTRLLRKICTACKNEIERAEKKPIRTWKHLSVKFRRNVKLRNTTGCAYVGGYEMNVGLGDHVRFKEVIGVIYHELMHIHGTSTHANGVCDPTSWQIDKLCSALDVQREATLPHTQIPKRKRDLTDERYQRLLERRKQWDSKLRRANNALKKLDRQIHSYERRMAAKP